MKINSVVCFDSYIVLTECSKSWELSICAISLLQVWGKGNTHRRGTDGVQVKIHESQIDHEIYLET